ncbi:hypothetical protein CTAYLR_009564 [Chrysophaeum taylorii]|uniref:G8 domain-containing protein n=1 Tax=Chrysophaeum taylorii TaxID=2483200 RepID=A0AAD7UJ00_9STRA|nr:hypothetical protein CTAYLR_009564 [Chrysophaeum taylorii]
MRHIIISFVVAAQGLAACTNGNPPPAYPASPPQDSSIASPRGQTVIAREKNSIVVDLGHPGNQYFDGQATSCPHDAPGLTDFEAVADASNNAAVTLPENTKVLLTSCSIPEGVVLGKITIPASSELIFADEDIELNAKGISVEGALRVGSESCRMRSSITITLHGSRPPDISTTQAEWMKGIDVDGGVLEIHGAEFYHAWSRLATTAHEGDKMLLIQDEVNWEAGMRVVVTTSQLRDARDWHQNEVSTIDKVRSASHLAPGATAVYLTTALKYDHWASEEYQAEVGLLSRRIKIQGDDASEPTDATPSSCANSDYASFPCENHNTGFGGHVIIRNAGAIGRISGTEFFRMGQTNFEGRYPLHWHLTGDAPDSYVRDSSIARSFFKCITLHGANKVRASRNVAFDVIGHCFYLEDGVEEDNVIEYNLAAHVHVIGLPPGAGGTDQNLEVERTSDTRSNPADSVASGFYISNRKNYVRGNAAVGGFAGFHFPVFEQALGVHGHDGPYKSDIIPLATYTYEFDGNSCRSSGYWWGHAACLYLGGVLRETTNSVREYFPGREAKLSPCEKNTNGCPQTPESGCTGEWPMGCMAYIEITNFKAAMMRAGIVTWGERARLRYVEIHDILVGPTVELFGDNTVENMVVTCRTDNFPAYPPSCDLTSKVKTFVPSEGGLLEGSECTSFDRHPWQKRGYAFTWYDASMNTALAGVDVRKCDPSTWPQCENECQSSSLFRSLNVGNTHTPEWQALTADFTFDSTENLETYVHNFGNRDDAWISGRKVAWIDATGGVCGTSWGQSIIGSNFQVGDWFKLYDQCVLLGQNSDMWCCQANNQWLAHLEIDWGDNGACPKQGNCPTIGYVAKSGDTNLELNGRPVTKQAEIVGPVPGVDSDLGYVWYLALDNGAPVELALSKLQVHHDAVLVVAITYPAGTSFDITMNANGGCKRDWLCTYQYERATSLEALAQRKPQYYVDGDTLFVRIIQRRKNQLAPTNQWDDETRVALFTNDYLRRVRSRDWGIPYRFDNPTVTIKADCPKSGKYCNGGKMPVNIPGFMWDGDSGVNKLPLPPAPTEPSLAPAFNPVDDGQSCRAIVDGDPNNEKDGRCPNSVFSDNDDPDILYAAEDDVVAGVRCCNGDLGSSECDTSCELVSFAEAKQRCVAKGNGWDLCTSDQVYDGQTKATGCNYDGVHVWTKTLGTCSSSQSRPSPKPTPSSVSCRAIVDGDPNNEKDGRCPNSVFSDNDDPDILYAAEDDVVAGVRCCNGDQGSSECDTSCELVSFAEAKQRCVAKGNGWDLCTSDQVYDGQTKATGCNYDGVHVWTKTLGTCASSQSRPSPKPTPSSVSCRAIVDGDPNNEKDGRCPNSVFSDNDDPDILYAAEDDVVAGVRCCNGDQGSSECDTSCELVSFAEAKQRCVAKGNGWDLCTSDQVYDGQTKATGCNYDGVHVWTKTFGTCTWTPAPSPASCRAIVDGNANGENNDLCPSALYLDEDEPDILYAAEDDVVAGVRCCNGDQGSSECDTSCELVSFAEAEQRCVAKGAGWDLCTSDQVYSGQTKGTGCSYDGLHVWTKTTGSCPPPGSGPTPESCRAIVDGNPNGENNELCPDGIFLDEDDPDILYAHEDDAVAGVRCCNGDEGSSECDAPCELVSFSEAKQRCAAKGSGWGLCTSTQVYDGQTKGTGCSYDGLHVWTKTTGTC